MVASFNVLMENFYKVTQSNNEKVTLLCHRIGRDPQSNPVLVPQKDDRQRCKSTSRIASSMQSTNISAALSGTCTVPLVPPTHN